MKHYLLLLIICVFPALVVAQTENPNYDAALANRLGADEYGMKQYILVILKTGPNTKTDKAYVDSCFASHMNNIKKLVKEGKLIVAGPISKNDKTYRGIFILNVTTFEDAVSCMSTDAAITERILEPEMYKWYGSAALPEYLPASDKINQKSF